MGKVVGRLRVEPSRNVFEGDEALEFVAQALPSSLTAEMSYPAGNAVGTILERSQSTGVRFLVRLIGLISWDNVLGMISLGVLLDRVFEVELVAVAYGIVMFTTARVTMWRVLGRRGQS